jgi:hypothetical protein
LVEIRGSKKPDWSKLDPREILLAEISGSKEHRYDSWVQSQASKENFRLSVFFWPLTLTQTDKLFFFIWPSFQSRELRTSDYILAMRELL